MIKRIFLPVVLLGSFFLANGMMLKVKVGSWVNRDEEGRPTAAHVDVIQSNPPCRTVYEVRKNVNDNTYYSRMQAIMHKHGSKFAVFYGPVNSNIERFLKAKIAAFESDE